MYIQNIIIVYRKMRLASYSLKYPFNLSLSLVGSGSLSTSSPLFSQLDSLSRHSSSRLIAPYSVTVDGCMARKLIITEKLCVKGSVVSMSVIIIMTPTRLKSCTEFSINACTEHDHKKFRNVKERGLLAFSQR